MDKPMELALLLARFKLQVKRTLGEAVDLERLTREPDYTRQRLAEIEEAAEEEELLVMVLRLRDLLMPAAEPAAPTVAVAPPPEMPAKTRETRNYLLGARAW